MSRFLFGGNQNNASQSKNLVEFRAGKMSQKGKMVTPDKRKGQVYIHQTEDSLMHFCWKDRTSGQVEDDLIIFPDDVEFKKVPQCTTGRVFVLKFKSNNRRSFYWMQEPKNEKDDDFCTKVNEYLNNPPQQGAGMTGGRAGSDLAGLAGDEDLQNLIQNMTTNQLHQLFNGFSGAANLSALLGHPSRGGSSETTTPTSRAAAATTTAAAASDATPMETESSAAPTASKDAAKPSSVQGRQLINDLSNILSNIKVPEGAGGSSSAASKIDLSGALSTSEALEPLISNTELMERVKEFLPPSEKADLDLSEQVKITVKSPQFRQAVSMFSAALGSGQLGPLMQQFGMPADVVTAAATGDMEAFVKALEESQKKPENQDAEMKE